MTEKETRDPKKRKTGFYFVSSDYLGLVWEPANWSQLMQTWQITGNSSSFRDHVMDAVDEKQIHYEGANQALQ